ncbi:unnamed protein product [Arabis nemorensis]|uniref:Uncharacterized protein n=1 Tax=Arabis nemorensis TaxID=586526 RepID=A0A565CE02_9BRAS|nr:unnamed protein product [Arabis nemorensis]
MGSVLVGRRSSRVGARVTPETADKDEWFVVKVIHFDRETKEVGSFMSRKLFYESKVGSNFYQRRLEMMKKETIVKVHEKTSDL